MLCHNCETSKPVDLFQLFKSNSFKALRMNNLIIMYSIYMESRTIILIWLAMFYCNANAQVTSGQQEFRDGDALWRQTVNYESITRNNPNVLADLNSMEVISDDHRMKLRFYDNDSVTVYENRMRYDYRQTDDSLQIIGSEGHLLRMVYDRPELYLRFPMATGDSIGGIYSGCGTYCERLFLHRFGRYKTVADGSGCIILPEGDTLKNVVRLRTERTISTLYLPLDSMIAAHGNFMSVPSLPLDSIRLYMQNDTAMAYVTIHRYYAQGFRYPVIEEMVVNNQEGEVVESTAYYCSPDEQAQLTDVENERLRGRYEWTVPGNMNDNSKKNDEGKFLYSLRNEPGSQQVIIDYSAAEGDVCLLLCDRNGIVYRRSVVSDVNGTVVVNYSGLRRGQYVVYIQTSNGQYSHKISVK